MVRFGARDRCITIQEGTGSTSCKRFYSILTACICGWSKGCSVSDWKNVKKALRRTTQELHSLQDITVKRAGPGPQTLSGTTHTLPRWTVSLLASGRRPCSIWCSTIAFHLHALRLVNSKIDSPLLLNTQTDMHHTHAHLLLTERQSNYSN